MDAIRIPPGSWSEMYASHLPSGDGRPPNAARLSKRGSPPRVGMEYTLDPAESLAVKTDPRVVGRECEMRALAGTARYAGG